MLQNAKKLKIKHYIYTLIIIYNIIYNKMSAPTITLKNVELYMGYKFEPAECAICRSDLCAPTQQDLSDNNVSKFELVVIGGECGHVFHKKCINSLKKNNFASCPMCNVVWREKDYLKSDISIV
jgi:hypothetical protein